MLFNPQGITVQIGFGYTKATDVKAAMSLRWRNSNGYSIYMSGLPVDNLEIMKLP